jgi:hypothetical protein
MSLVYPIPVQYSIYRQRTPAHSKIYIILSIVQLIVASIFSYESSRIRKGPVTHGLDQGS